MLSLCLHIVFFTSDISLCVLLSAIPYHETAIVVYKLETKNSQLYVRLKLIDWVTMKPVHGWIFIIVKDLKKGTERVYVEEANPFVEFIT